MFQSEILTGVIRCDKLDTETAESGDEMSEVRKHFVVHGKVQGVGFRYTAKYLALSLGLTGWARNEWDGTVTMEVQGREALINKLLVGLNQNQFISIEWIDTKEIPLEEEKAFTVNEGKKNLDNSIERTGRSRMKLGLSEQEIWQAPLWGALLKTGY